jgi:predicted nuclease with TOPRIM domain
MSNQLNKPANGAQDALQNARAEVSHLEQLSRQHSDAFMDRLQALAANLQAVTQERDQLREEVERLKAALSESQTDVELYQRSVLALTERPWTITQEDLEEIQRTQVTYEEMMAEIVRPEGE